VLGPGCGGACGAVLDSFLGLGTGRLFLEGH
jgi:hypothetical protein